MTKGPCAKQTVTATIIAPDGRKWVGTNECSNPQKVCPRGNMPSGAGYWMCRDICQQEMHAEKAALRAAAGKDLTGGVLYLDGHTYLCGPCEVALADAGVSRVIFGVAP